MPPEQPHNQRADRLAVEIASLKSVAQTVSADLGNPKGLNLDALALENYRSMARHRRLDTV